MAPAKKSAKSNKTAHVLNLLAPNADRDAAPQTAEAEPDPPATLPNLPPLPTSPLSGR